MHRSALCFALSFFLYVTIVLMGAATQAAQLQLSWDPPTANSNGTPLGDLAGYKIHYGQTDGNYTTTLTLGNITTYTVPNLQAGQMYYFVATGYDVHGNESNFSNEVNAIVPNNNGQQSLRLLTADFNTNATGFVYRDNAFRNTQQPNYASGTWLATGSATGGALKILLGGLDNTPIVGMAGVWRQTFTLPATAEVTLSFRYKLTQAANYESDEYSEVIVTVDDRQLGSAGKDYVARVAGDGNGGSPLTTNWQVFQTTLGPLTAGQSENL